MLIKSIKLEVLQFLVRMGLWNRGLGQDKRNVVYILENVYLKILKTYNTKLNYKCHYVICITLPPSSLWICKIKVDDRRRNLLGG